MTRPAKYRLPDFNRDTPRTATPRPHPDGRIEEILTEIDNWKAPDGQGALTAAFVADAKSWKAHGEKLGEESVRRFIAEQNGDGGNV